MTEFLIAEFIGFIKKHNLIQSEDSILIALSGGKDSTVLTDILVKVQELYKLRLAVAHLNHRLRGVESDEDVRHCENLAGKYEIPFYHQTADVRSFSKEHKQSIEQAAHILRYRFLNDTAREYGFNKIATAHTRNDQSETILMAVLKGGRWESLQGIPVCRNNVIRPLLWCSGEKIIKYLTINNLIWREDSSNKELLYKRNRIRHELLPLLQSRYNPEIIDALFQLGRYFSEIRDLTETVSQKYYAQVVSNENDEQIILDCNLLKSLPLPVQKEIIRVASVRLFSSDNPLSSHLENNVIDELERMTTGKRFTFGKTGEFFYDRGNLVIRKWNDHKFNYQIRINEKFSWDEEKLEFESKIISNTNKYETWDEVINYDVFVGKEVVLRSWQNGDSFLPFGQFKKCKLSDFFINQKIPVYNKHRIPLLVAGDEIIWVCGYRISEKARVTGDTRQKVGMSCKYIL